MNDIRCSSKLLLLSMELAIRACRRLQATAAEKVEGRAVLRLASLSREGALERPAYQIIDFSRSRVGRCSHHIHPLRERPNRLCGI